MTDPTPSSAPSSRSDAPIPSARRTGDARSGARADRGHPAGRSRLVVGAASASAALLLIGGMASAQARANAKKDAVPATVDTTLAPTTLATDPVPPPTTIVVRHLPAPGSSGTGSTSGSSGSSSSGSGSSSAAATPRAAAPTTTAPRPATPPATRAPSPTTTVSRGS